jgi:hypothetical protein
VVEIFYLVSVLAPNILSPSKVRKACYSLAEFDVKSVYLNLFEWRGREIHETLEEGQDIKIWESVPYMKCTLT